MQKIPDFNDLNSEQKVYFTDLFEQSTDESLHSLSDELESIDKRYLQTKHLASGGMKDIYICKDNVTNRLIAKAVLKGDKSKTAIEDFLREARLTAYLQHPNIMPVYDMGKESDGSPFFTMKLIEGQTLSDFILTSPNTKLLNDNLRIFLKICEAIAYAHSKSILHLDIKPDNIQVSSFGNVIVSDWGIAKIIKTKVTEAELESYMLNENLGEQGTLNGYIKGTPGYLAPEQVSKDFGKKDERTDVYALGALLYFILTGKSMATGADTES
ncbi:MAG: serine/threonine protein kinase, partial [Lentisphaeraceae bacterium]|nr:serine/threonine protein kinase [Lentisphaeraceae bacterium]